MSGDERVPNGSASRTTQMAERMRARTAERLESRGDRLATIRASRRAGLLVVGILLGLAGLGGVAGAVVTQAWLGLASGGLLLVAAVLLLRMWRWMPLLVPDPGSVEVRRRARRHLLVVAAVVAGAVVAAALAVSTTP